VNILGLTQYSTFVLSYDIFELATSLFLGKWRATLGFMNRWTKKHLPGADPGFDLKIMLKNRANKKIEKLAFWA